jgi:hypothetical protein
VRQSGEEQWGWLAKARRGQRHGEEEHGGARRIGENELGLGGFGGVWWKKRKENVDQDERLYEGSDPLSTH